MAEHGASAHTELTESTVDENHTRSSEEDDGFEEDFDVPARERHPRSPVRLAVMSSLTAIVMLVGLVGWLSHRVYQTHETQQQRQQFLAVGRQAALNLTTIDFNEVDKDVSRILNSATGGFLDDFQKRSQPFIDVVKQAKSKSQGTVVESGIESVRGDQAQVLVAVQVKTSIEGSPEQQPRGWRMRIDVQKVGSEVKVANVQFVP
jgi:Mce-associated membrane protein